MILSKLFVWCWPSKPNEDCVYRDHADWARRYAPPNGVPGKFVLEHAREKYRETADVGRHLDDKAGKLLTTAGTLATILFAALAVFNLSHVWLSFPSIVCFLVAMILALRCAQPHWRSGLPTIREVVERFSDGKPGYEARLSATLHDAAEELRVLHRWKANMLLSATLSLGLGVVLLALLAVCAWFGCF